MIRIFLILLVVFIFAITYVDSHIDKKVRNEFKIDTIVTIDTVYIETEIMFWDEFIEAIAFVESGNDTEAYNPKTDATGYLQITKIIVEDCNRILGRKEYTMNDRYDKDKSIEMFNIIQNHYNTRKYFHLALKLWNPRSSIKYNIAVENKYIELVKNKCGL